MEELSFDEGLATCLEFRGRKMLGVSQELVSTLSIRDVFLELLV